MRAPGRARRALPYGYQHSRAPAALLLTLRTLCVTSEVGKIFDFHRFLHVRRGHTEPGSCAHVSRPSAARGQSPATRRLPAPAQRHAALGRDRAQSFSWWEEMDGGSTTEAGERSSATRSNPGCKNSPSKEPPFRWSKAEARGGNCFFTPPLPV